MYVCRYAYMYIIFVLSMSVYMIFAHLNQFSEAFFGINKSNTSQLISIVLHFSYTHTHTHLVPRNDIHMLLYNIFCLLFINIFYLFTFYLIFLPILCIFPFMFSSYRLWVNTLPFTKVNVIQMLIFFLAVLYFLHTLLYVLHLFLVLFLCFAMNLNSVRFFTCQH